MKKAIAILLVVVLVTAACPVCFAQEAEDALTFALASDLHYNPPGESLVYISEHPVYWYANRRAAMEDESGFIIDEFLNQCAEDDAVQYVLISGDLADNGKGRPEDHEAVAEKLRAFEQRTGKDVFVINGNHDAGNNCATTYDDFKRIYADFGYDKALATAAEDCSYTADLGGKYRLIALDSNDPDKSTEDGMSAKKLDWVRRQTEQAKVDGRYPVVMMHHNLLDHLPMQRLLSHDFIVRFHNTTAALLADWGVRLVMTGHEHCSDAAVFTSPAGNVIHDLATTSLTMYPLQYRVLTLNDDLIRYEARTVDGIDLGALTAAVDGYTDAQLALMGAGLNDYAKGFLKQGVKYRLELSLSMEKLGIKESDLYYDLVKTAVDGLTGLMNMPLYGENGAAALAEEYNITLPQTDYETGWDLATELVARHYAGGENLTVDSPEVMLLLRLAALLLRTDLADVNDKIFLKAANELLGNDEGVTARMTKLCASVFGGVKPGEFFLVALLSPLLYEFAFDADGVDDNNGAFEGYGADGTFANVNHLSLSLRHTLDRLVAYIKGFIMVLLRMFKIEGK
ncbi:MAG: metallophosphoesterase [Clostridia bacterium]|nr:metallophosphoesterase [Clostridia bacterium]